MPQRRSLAVLTGAVGAAVALVALTTPAAAHPSFDLASVPAASDQRLQLRLPAEGMDETTSNARVRLLVPAGFDVLECVPPPAWDCGVFDEGDQGTTIQWAAVAPAPAQLFDLIVHTPTRLGRYATPVEQHLSDGTVVRWTDPPDGLHPAPAVRVSAAGSPPAPNSALPTPHEPTTTLDDPGAATPPVDSGRPDGGGSAGQAVSPTTAPSSRRPATARPRPQSAEPWLPADVPASIPRDPIGLGLPSDEGPPPMELTLGRLLAGLAALLGAVVLRLLLRRADPAV